MALTQVPTGMIADGSITAAKLAGDVISSPLTVKIISDSTNITLNDVGSGYNNLGSTFSAVIPTNGIIRVSATFRLQNDFAGAANNTVLFGIRIGTTNYWFGDYISTGVSSKRQYLLQSSSALNDYIEVSGSGSASGTGSAVAQDMNIAARSIPTGTQTIQIITSRTAGSPASSLRGATTTTRVLLEFISAS